MDDVLDRKRALYLQQIIETGSVRAAAELLGVDASVVSRAVARLEQDIGATLLERSGRGVVPTDAGRLVAVFARRQQDLDDTFFAEINDLRNASRGHVQLVLGEGFVDLVMAPVLKPFVDEHPEITCALHVCGTDEAVRWIVEDKAHVGFTFHPPDDVRLRSHYSRLSSFRAHVRKDHPLARKRRALRLVDLLPYRGATLDESFGVRKLIAAAELEENVSLPAVLQTNSFKVLWEFAAQGMGYILAPRSLPLKGAQLRQLVSLPLASPLLNRSRIHVLTRAGRHLPPAAAQFLRHVVQAMPHV
ncbi:LysR family transcriptional regulator [Verticiella sediminum]|uniref:LysR family transcriptional regulator n=1 Tax=Verticiella sediminum TaxID=1247510 RepID=A0A556AJT1_9BURK|nr:LysR family transcriptional regulator [Verticiella sediminum]TSH93115.1 LysR family transcriptional regulator [Verticiella sediminum]